MLDIIEETDDWIVLNKPGGLVVHPTKGDIYSSLISRLRLYFEGTDVEPRFVNRLDRETSGVVVVSKNRPAHKLLCRQLDQAKKLYWAVVEGQPADSGTIDRDLGKAEGSPVIVKQAVVEEGKRCRTHWKRLDTQDGWSLLEIHLETGRMHQIRVHFQWLGHPLIGEKLYGHDETLYLEFTESDWTERHERELAARRQLLTAIEVITPDHHWKAAVPEDIAKCRKWQL